MRRKRLKHSAYIFCHMFCGWQGPVVLENKLTLPLGNGVFYVDILTGECSFNGQLQKSLTIGKTLNQWFKEDCKSNRIDIKFIENAELDVKVFYSNLDDKRVLPVKKGDFWRYDCHSKIKTDEAQYESRYRKLIEWHDSRSAQESEGEIPLLSDKLREGNSPLFKDRAEGHGCF